MKTCCFVGHRTIELSETLIRSVREVVLTLLNEGVEIFLFGSQSQFDDLCYKIVTELKKTHPNIRRAYIRAEFPFLNNYCTDFLLNYYEETFFLSELEHSGKLVYVKRNQRMIEVSDYCVFYYNPNYTVPGRNSDKKKTTNSGTKLAYDYAVSKHKIIYNLYSKKPCTHWYKSE